MNSFKCKKCGQCCSNYLPLTTEEIKRLKKLAKKENKPIYLKDWKDCCPFLNSKMQCDIYKDRPIICQEYNCYNFENHTYSKRFMQILEKEENKFRLVDIRKEIFNN